MPFFPPEVIELIVDEVALVDDSNTFSAVKAIAPTNRVFYEASRRHIWESVKLVAPLVEMGKTNKQGLDKYQRFLDVATTSPEVLKYIRSFHIQDNFVDCSILIQSTLPAIIYKLQNITKLTWTFNPKSWLVGNYDWLHCSPELQQALTTKIFSNTTKHLSISYVKNLPFDFGKCFTYFPTVQLNEISFLPADWPYQVAYDGVNNIGTRKRCLKDLTICSLDFDKVRPLISGLSFTDFNLGKFKVDASAPGRQEEMLIAKEIAKHHAQSIHTLELPTRHIPSDAVALFPLYSIPHLRKLMVFLHYNDPAWFESTIDILKSASNPNEIEQIVIEAHYAIIQEVEVLGRGAGAFSFWMSC